MTGYSRLFAQDQQGITATIGTAFCRLPSAAAARTVGTVVAAPVSLIAPSPFIAAAPREWAIFGLSLWGRLKREVMLML